MFEFVDWSSGFFVYKLVNTSAPAVAMFAIFVYSWYGSIFNAEDFQGGIQSWCKII